jgi:hypothetical protein
MKFSEIQGETNRFATTVTPCGSPFFQGLSGDLMIYGQKVLRIAPAYLIAEHVLQKAPEYVML